jgi:hypothetical protein
MRSSEEQIFFTRESLERRERALTETHRRICDHQKNRFFTRESLERRERALTETHRRLCDHQKNRFFTRESLERRERALTETHRRICDHQKNRFFTRAWKGASARSQKRIAACAIIRRTDFLLEPGKARARALPRRPETPPSRRRPRSPALAAFGTGQRPGGVSLFVPSLA